MKKKTLKYLFIFIFTLVFNLLFAGNISKIDSLEKKLKISNDKEKLLILTELINNTDSASGKYLNYNYQLVEIALKMNNYPIQILCYNRIGNILLSTEKNKEALSYFYKALIISNIIKDKINTVNSINNIGIAYFKLNKFKKAKRYFEYELIISKSLKYDTGIINAQKNIGLIYYYQKDINKSFDYNRNSGFRASENNNMLEYCKFKYEFGILYYSYKHYDKVIYCCNQGIEIAKKYNYFDCISKNYELLSKVYKDKKDYKKSLEYYQLHINIKDTLYNIEKHKQIIDIQTKYETDKKVKEIFLLTKDNWIKELKLEKNKTILISSVVFIILIFVILFIIYVLYNTKRTKNELLYQTIKAEEKERERLAKDMHDALNPLLNSTKKGINEIEITNDKNNAIIESINDFIDNALITSREIQINISPSYIKRFGLFAGVESYCDKINNIGTLYIIYDLEEYKKIRFDEWHEVILYRVILELINNTIKHAEAKKITIATNIIDEKLSIIYTDDGVGFDYEKTIKDYNKGYGLNNIINRIKLIKGNYSYKSSYGYGVEVKIEVKKKII